MTLNIVSAKENMYLKVLSLQTIVSKIVERKMTSSVQNQPKQKQLTTRMANVDLRIRLNNENTNYITTNQSNCTMYSSLWRRFGWKFWEKKFWSSLGFSFLTMFFMKHLWGGCWIRSLQQNILYLCQNIFNHFLRGLLSLIRILFSSLILAFQ